MPVPKGPLDSPGFQFFLGEVVGFLHSWMDVQEGYLALARERWEYTKDQTPERISQQNRHMDIQEQRIKLQQQKFVAEHGNWPGIDLEDNEPE